MRQECHQVQEGTKGVRQLTRLLGKKAQRRPRPPTDNRAVKKAERDNPQESGV